MKWFSKGDQVVTKAGEQAKVMEAKPDGFVVVRVEGEHHGRSVWSGNLQERRDDET